MVAFIRSDLEFILAQILIAERNAAGEVLIDILPNVQVPWGLRTVDGSFNNLVPGQSSSVRRTTSSRACSIRCSATPRPGTSYAQTSGFVFELAAAHHLQPDRRPDRQQPGGSGRRPLPRTQPSAPTTSERVEIHASAGRIAFGTPTTRRCSSSRERAPDAGLSAPFNAWFTFFGQFFDHGLDLVTKGGSGTIFIPLQPDDPLFVEGSPTNFMVLTRATNRPGPDGILGTADDIHEHENTTSPFVDQNQTYTSHPSHQVFLRAYDCSTPTDGRCAVPPAS